MHVEDGQLQASQPADLHDTLAPPLPHMLAGHQPYLPRELADELTVSGQLARMLGAMR